MKIPAALYCRVSSDKQVQDGTIESQVSSLRDFAKENNFFIEEDFIFTDNGVSGATLVRPALDALRDKAVSGEVRTVLLLCPDRLARKYAHQLILIEEFQRLGVEIIFSNRDISQSPEDQLLLQIQGVISEYEREKIMERSRRGKLQKASKGSVSVLSGAPYGYIYITRTDSCEARYEVHPEEAEVVKNIFKWYAYDKLSIGAISKRLNQTGIPTRQRQGPWERSTVWGMLKNPAYHGQAAFRKTKVVERVRPTKLARDNSFYPKSSKSSSRDRSEQEWIYIPVPAIITSDIFKIVSQQLKENKKLSPRNNKKYEYLLSSLLHCKECGYSIYGKPASNSRYKRCYYRCMGQDGHRWPNGRVCSSHPVRVEVLDDLVWEQTVKLIKDPQTVLKEYTNRLHEKQNTQQSLADLILKKRKELRQINYQKERLLDLYQKGSLNLSEIESRLQKLRGKIKQLESERLSLEHEQKQDNQQLQLIDQLQEFQKKVSSNLNLLNFEQKKEIVRLLVREVEVDIKAEEITVRHVVPKPKRLPLCTGSQWTPLRGSFPALRTRTIFHHSCFEVLTDQF